jgi:Tol biopolymer transport system component
MNTGDRLGPYQIVATIGAGGMGEVYRARDTRLGRDVAIKVSHENFNDRFEREARSIAALNHPNICHLYDVGPNYLVMELIDGEAIKGPLPLDTALDYARQIADALAAAHERGIIHRDLKPANILITSSGIVKVLDFGLAKTAESPAGDPASSPTMTISPTRAGMILGTAGYMAPEQARGKNVDKRADIWAFGVVLFEMLTGKKLFEGETVSDILAGVLKEKPDLTAVPVQVRRLLRSCLQKDPRERLNDIGDAKLLLDEFPTPAAARQEQPWLWPAVAVVALAALAFVLFFHLREAPLAEPVSMKFEIPAPAHGQFLPQMALSPDGRLLAFTARSGADGAGSIWVRRLDSLEATPLRQSSTGQPFFWSPDSRFIAYNGNGTLTKIDVSGGPPQVVCDAPQGVIGGFWNRDGNIVFGQTGPFMRAPATGGVAEPVATAAPDEANLLPVLLPDGRHFIYFGGSSTTGGRILVSSLDAKSEPKYLMDAAVGVAFAPSADGASGHLLFLRDSTLMAQPFDLGKLALTGSPVPLAQGVGASLAHGFFSVSSNGVLAYRIGPAGNSRLVSLDRNGKEIGSVGQAGDYRSLALSPDGAHVAASRLDGRNVDIWLFDLARNTSTRVTSDPAPDDAPVWSADGKRIAFSSGSPLAPSLSFKLFNNDAKPETLLPPTANLTPCSFSRDGRYLIYSAHAGKALKTHLLSLSLEGDRKLTLLTQTEFNESQAQFSPDGHWISYTSDESGKREIYVRPFPLKPEDGKVKVSEGGGTHSRWRRDGKELFYLSGDNVMALEASTAAGFKASVPKALFTMRTGGRAGGTYRWDVSADGQRFLFAVNAVDRVESPITIVTNWQSLLKK